MICDEIDKCNGPTIRFNCMLQLLNLYKNYFKIVVTSDSEHESRLLNFPL